MSPAVVVIVMGVSGSGKTTVGQQLARDLGWRFLDADDFHSPQSIQRMAAGRPLTDADRAPWLARLRHVVADALACDEPTVLACSALKESYRRLLDVDRARVRFVYLKGEAGLLRQRLRQRSGHFAKANLLDSQLATLEEPVDPPAFTVGIDERPERLAERIRAGLHLEPLAPPAA